MIQTLIQWTTYLRHLRRLVLKFSIFLYHCNAVIRVVSGLQYKIAKGLHVKWPTL